MMLEIPDVLSPSEALECRQALERASWRDGRHTAGAIAAEVKHNEQLAQDDALGVRLGEFILQRLGSVEPFMAAALPLKVLPPRFNRHTGGGHYGDHIDSAILSVPNTPHRIRSDLSATLFLSDPRDYDGGELVVQGESGPRRVKLPAGHMFLYSGTTLHQVEPVTRGARFAAFFWIQSLVRGDHERGLLLQLDQSIGSLRQAVPGNPELAKLTGLYHNLLRHWANT